MGAANWAHRGEGGESCSRSKAEKQGTALGAIDETNALIYAGIFAGRGKTKEARAGGCLRLLTPLCEASTSSRTLISPSALGSHGSTALARVTRGDDVFSGIASA